MQSSRDLGRDPKGISAHLVDPPGNASVPIFPHSTLGAQPGPLATITSRGRHATIQVTVACPAIHHSQSTPGTTLRTISPRAFTQVFAVAHVGLLLPRWLLRLFRTLYDRTECLSDTETHQLITAPSGLDK